ncbi:uncharacterized protein PHALS_15499 [Plasmopara halstedii]|uniref:Uncharacterized protein n=1 Tax=Plasmopara halstedii TaxID=4781 RepID=A0A0P1AW96_PLAHL|nr:uncharacterized protein PHALS_15499 [Plasmopara halstedii]CEG44820.1 hypothetical protein PHALS_15499 [Plasmopara halstedii]|eukprot:XP_024581189.1 hypothetical protein PHALS_15499 [Plasmopara halstedii]
MLNYYVPSQYNIRRNRRGNSSGWWASPNSDTRNASKVPAITAGTASVARQFSEIPTRCEIIET